MWESWLDVRRRVRRYAESFGGSLLVTGGQGFANGASENSKENYCRRKCKVSGRDLVRWEIQFEKVKKRYRESRGSLIEN